MRRPQPNQRQKVFRKSQYQLNPRQPETRHIIHIRQRLQNQRQKVFRKSQHQLNPRQGEIRHLKHMQRPQPNQRQKLLRRSQQQENLNHQIQHLILNLTQLNQFQQQNQHLMNIQ